MATKKDLRRKRIKFGIKKKITGTAERPRLSVFRSNKLIYAQLIDDVNGKSITSTSSSASDKGDTKIDSAKKVGVKIAELAKEKGVESVVFDRNGYLYHGRVQALAEGAREAGLKF